MTIEIPLTQGKVALIDDEDLQLVSGYKWYARDSKCTFYAIAHEPGTHRTVYMHRLIANPGERQPVDHIDFNGLHNVRSNLRTCTNQQNGTHIRSSADKATYRGVKRAGRKWMARIGNNGKQEYLGIFETPEEAAREYDRVAEKRFGVFARLNF
jgi:hypothetical protein